MAKDWPDPSGEERDVSLWAIWTVGAISAFGALAMIWGWLP